MRIGTLFLAYKRQPCVRTRAFTRTLVITVRLSRCVVSGARCLGMYPARVGHSSVANFVEDGEVDQVVTPPPTNRCLVLLVAFQALA